MSATRSPEGDDRVHHLEAIDNLDALVVEALDARAEAILRVRPDLERPASPPAEHERE